MYIHFDKLAEALEKKYKTQTYNISSRIITGIEMLPRDFNESVPLLQKDIIYICEYKRLIRYYRKIELAPIICVIEPNVIVDTAFLANRSIIAIYGSSTMEILLALTNLIYEYGIMSSHITEVSRALLNCKSFQELLDTGYQILTNPIIITDVNQKILAHTEPEIILNPVYNEILEWDYLPNGHPTVESIQSYWDLAYIKDTPLEDEYSGEIPAVICKTLVYGGNINGYLHVLQFNRNFTEQDSAITELLGNFFAIELSRQNKNRVLFDQKEQFAQFIKDILDNDEWDSDYINQKLKHIGIRLKKYMYTIVIQTRRVELVPLMSLNDLSKQISELLPNCIGILYRNSIFLLLGSDNEINNFEEVMSPVLSILTKNNLIAGISNVFTSLHQIRKCGFQAIKALQLGVVLQKDRVLYLYHDYAVYYMLELCLKVEDSGMFYLPEINRLISSENRNIDYLLETLKAYLMSGRSKTRTAREMNIHLNTIKYRISLLEDILQVNLDNDESSFKLLLSLKMLEYQEAFPTYEPLL